MCKEKEFDNWNQRNDHANGEELMVNVTLAEYRELIAYKAKADFNIAEVRAKNAECEKKIAEAKKTIDELNAKIIAMMSIKETAE